MIRSQFAPILACLALLFMFDDANAQIKLGQNMRLSGNVTAQYLYTADTSLRGGFGASQRPTHFPQLTSRLNLSYKNKFSIPIQLVLNPIMQFNGGINTPMEGPESLNILQYLSHPSNQIYANPRFKSFNFHVGHFVQFYSPLTAGDMKVFGLGAEYKLNKFSFAAQRGILQPRVLNVPFNFGNGAYQRSLTAFRIKFDQSQSLSTSFNFAFAGDNENSLEDVPFFSRPQQSAVVSLQSSYAPNQNTRLQVEISNSAFAPDVTADDTLREFGVGSFLIPNTSVFGGSAVELSGSTKFGDQSVNGRFGYRSQNFRTLAYPFLQSDMLEFEVNPTIIALNKKLQANVMLAYKGSNISKATGRSLRIPIAKLSTNYIVNDDISINAIYAFNSVSSTEDPSQASINSVNQIIRFLPTYRLQTNKLQNIFSVIVGLNQYTNKSDIFPTPLKASTGNLGLIYRAVYGKHSGGISINSLNTKLNGTSTLRYTSITVSARTRLMDNKMMPFARFTTTGARNTTGKVGNKLVGQIGTQYVVTNKLSASFGASLQYHRQGTVADSPAFREIVIRTGLNYRL